MPFDDAGFTQRQINLEILRAARDRVSVRGSWCQGMFYDGSGAHCAIGWLRAVAPPRERERVTHILATEVLMPILSRGGWQNVEEWNDEPSRRRRDVVRLFDRAIARLESADG